MTRLISNIRRTLLLSTLLVAASPVLHAQTSDAQQVAAANEQLRAAMLAPDAAKLEPLLHDHLTYGHSSAKIDTKTSLINALLTGTSKFSRIDLSNQKVDVVGKVATIRYVFDADTHPAGKPATPVHLQVLSVWVQEPSGWKMLARQAVNQPN